MDEFSFIKECLSPLAGPEGLGLLDDAALMRPRPGYDLVLTKDTMVEGVHFPREFHGGETAGKLLRVNLSDLAAKGATPRGYLLSIAWPKGVNGQDFRLKARLFAGGLERIQDEFKFHLYGGDTVKTDGPMVVSATFIGEVPLGKMITRSGALSGDDIWVSGSIGDAVLGLRILTVGHDKFADLSIEQQKVCVDAYWRPEPRLGLGDVLREYATSSVDISDGLMADLGHIAKASGMGLIVNIEDIPLSTGTAIWANQAAERNRVLDLITGGDDYEVAFTAHSKHRDAIEIEANALGVQLTRIGRCETGYGLRLNDKSGHLIPIKQSGYRHF